MRAHDNTSSETFPRRSLVSSLLLLAATSAVFAFALVQAQHNDYERGSAFFAAVIFWLLSYSAGWHALHLVEAARYNLSELLRIERGTHTRVGPDTEKIAAAAAGVRSAISKQRGVSRSWLRWQLALLIAGAIFYAI
jgi:hypothetical protein